MSPATTKPTKTGRAAEQAIASEFGDRMRVARKTSNLTLREVSEATGISITYLSDLERGALANPTLDKLVLIARTLGVPIARLVGADEGADQEALIPPALEELRRMPQFAEAVAAQAKRWRTTPAAVENEWVKALNGIAVLGRRPPEAFDYLFIFEAVRRALEKT